MKRRDNRRQAIWWGVSALVVLSMVCSLVLVVAPTPAPRATPTPTPAATAGPVVFPPLAPVVSDDAGFTFAVAGNTHESDAFFAEIIRRVSAEQPAFLIHTGDLVSSGLAQEYEALQAMLAGLDVPMYPVPGERDSSDGSVDAFLAHSGAPAACYAVDYEQAHLAFLDTHLGDLGPKQMAWLDADLAATAQPLKIVVLHHPPFDPAGSGEALQTDGEAFMALMEKHGVRYVFAGHLQGYTSEVRNGVTYVVIGGSDHYLRVHVHGQDLTYEVVSVGGQ